MWASFCGHSFCGHSPRPILLTDDLRKLSGDYGPFGRPASLATDRLRRLAGAASAGVRRVRVPEERMRRHATTTTAVQHARAPSAPSFSARARAFRLLRADLHFSRARAISLPPFDRAIVRQARRTTTSRIGPSRRRGRPSRTSSSTPSARRRPAWRMAIARRTSRATSATRRASQTTPSTRHTAAAAHAMAARRSTTRGAQSTTAGWCRTRRTSGPAQGSGGRIGALGSGRMRAVL